MEQYFEHIASVGAGGHDALSAAKLGTTSQNPCVSEHLTRGCADFRCQTLVRQLQSSPVMQADSNRPGAVWQFYVSEGIALRALASVGQKRKRFESS